MDFNFIKEDCLSNICSIFQISMIHFEIDSNKFPKFFLPILAAFKITRKLKSICYFSRLGVGHYLPWIVSRFHHGTLKSLNNAYRAYFGNKPLMCYIIPISSHRLNEPYNTVLLIIRNKEIEENEERLKG